MLPVSVLVKLCVLTGTFCVHGFTEELRSSEHRLLTPEPKESPLFQPKSPETQHWFHGSQTCTGGERKRLTAAEQLVGPRPVIIMDEVRGRFFWVFVGF